MKRFYWGLAVGIALTAFVMSAIWHFAKDDIVYLPPEIITKIDTVFVEKEIIITETVNVTKIDTIFVDNEVESITASATIEIEQEDIKGDLTVEFEYFSQIFTLKSTNLIYSGEIITSETLKTEYINVPIPPFKPLISSGIWRLGEEFSMSLGAGVRIYGKLDIILNASSQKQIGIVANWRM